MKTNKKLRIKAIEHYFSLSLRRHLVDTAYFELQAVSLHWQKKTLVHYSFLFRFEAIFPPTNIIPTTYIHTELVETLDSNKIAEEFIKRNDDN